MPILNSPLVSLCTCSFLLFIVCQTFALCCEHPVPYSVFLVFLHRWIGGCAWGGKRASSCFKSCFYCVFRSYPNTVPKCVRGPVMCHSGVGTDRQDALQLGGGRITREDFVLSKSSRWYSTEDCHMFHHTFQEKPSPALFWKVVFVPSVSVSDMSLCLDRGNLKVASQIFCLVTRL